MSRNNDRARAMIKRLWWEWCWPHRSLIAINLVLIIAFASVNGLYAPLIKHLVDNLATGIEGLGAWLVVALLVAFAKAASLLGHRLVNNRIFARISTDLQHELFVHMVGADVAWHGREAAAARAARVTGYVAAVTQMMERVINHLLRDILMLIALVGSMFYIDWQLALIVMGVFPIAILPVLRISRSLRKFAREVQEQRVQLSASFNESMASIRVIKAYRLERAANDRAGRLLEALRLIRVRAADHAAFVDPIMEVLGGVAVVGVIFVVSWRLGTGENTLGDFAGFLTALLIAAQPMRALSNLVASVQTGLAAAEKIFEILDQPPKVVDAPAAVPLTLQANTTGPTIRLEHVSFTYGDAGYALHDVSFEVRGGASLALVGPSGAGKSTVFNLIPRLYDPTSGRVLIDEQDISRATIASLRRQIAFVAQEAVLFNDTVAANIAAGALDRASEPSRAEIVEAARAAAAHAFVEELPKGYDTVIGDRGDRLSGGQRQRLSIARAFLRNAPILLLDEATSALDSEAERLITEALDRLRQGRTTIVIAHRFATIRDVDSIVVLDQGRVVEVGDHEGLLAEGRLYAHLHTLQYAEGNAG